MRGTAAEAARLLAELLGHSLSYHERHADRDACPVCKTEGVIDAAWVKQTRVQIERLRSAAVAADSASRESKDAIGRARAMVAAPSWLPLDSPGASALGRVGTRGNFRRAGGDGGPPGAYVPTALSRMSHGTG